MKHYFEESRLHITAFGEFVVRLISYITYAALTALAVVLFISYVPQLMFAAILIFLFLTDRVIHLHHGEKSIQETVKSEKLNLAQLLTPASYKSLSYAFRKSLALEKSFHLVLLEKILEHNDVKEALRRLDVDTKDFSIKLSGRIEKTGNETKNKEALLNDAASIVDKAYIIAKQTQERFIRPRNLLVALSLEKNPQAEKLFQLFDITAPDLEEAIIFGRFRSMLSKIKRVPQSLGGFAHQPRTLRKRIMNRAWTARPTPYLDKFSKDLTVLARYEELGLLIGHQQEFNRLLTTLSRPDKPNALLVGEPGIGMSTIISHLAFRIIKDEIPKSLFDKRLIELDIGSLIADASTEEVAGRLRKITDEIVGAGNIIVFIPNIHNLFKSVDTGGGVQIMDIFIPIIKSNNVPFIGETYSREFKKYIGSRSDFMDQFDVLRIEEISREEATRILTYQSIILEHQFDITISLRAVRKAVDLAYRYFRTKPLPANAMDLLKQSLVKVSRRNEKILDENQVIETAQELSKIPVHRAEGEEVEKLLNLEELIHKRLINQDAAVRAVSRSLREYRSGLSRKGGPIAVFLFVGPTGVGKTELSKILAGIQFGSRDEMIRLDMSEYQEKQSISRLIGSSDGDRGGALTDAVMEKPYSLILLDEFEKAHPDILNIFLQVFDDGRLTDSMGHTVDFENTIIIATSNAHSNLIKERIESETHIEEIAEELKQKLTEYFKPELLNRFSDVVVFRSLNVGEIEKIAGILITEMTKQITVVHGIDIEVEQSAVKKIAELGYSPVFGARPLRATISENIKSVIAEKILKKEIARGNVLKISFDNKFKFEITR